MLPTLSSLSVSNGPGGRLRHWYSSRYQRISPLHREFPRPLPCSSLTVSNALLQLSCRISHSTCKTTYTRFTPSDSEQRLHPSFYRGCWHEVSRCFFFRYRLTSTLLHTGISFRSKGVYDPKTFILHAAWLRQAFAHCARFFTAASRRSPGRISVPVWLIILSDQLPVQGLVGYYPANYLIGRDPFLK